jgi:hypothetical protein
MTIFLEDMRDYKNSKAIFIHEKSSWGNFNY